jgi:hypothetical protein
MTHERQSGESLEKRTKTYFEVQYTGGKVRRWKRIGLGRMPVTSYWGVDTCPSRGRVRKISNVHNMHEPQEISMAEWKEVMQHPSIREKWG